MSQDNTCSDCGRDVVNFGGVWRHVNLDPSECTARLVATPEYNPAADRPELLAKLAEVREGLTGARDSIQAMKAQLRHMDERLSVTQGSLSRADYVRAATLSEAWDALLDAGFTEAGTVIAKMLKADRERASRERRHAVGPDRAHAR